MKQDIRKQVMRLRDTLTPIQIQAHSARICETLLPYLKGCVGSYSAIDSEVDVSMLLQTINTPIALPKTYSNHTITFFQVDVCTKLIKGVYGIFEPDGTQDACTVDVLLVPLVAFDAQCNRLGHGAGYYDRYLENYQGITIGIAHECQKVECVYEEAHDVPLSMIVTEERIYKRSME